MEQILAAAICAGAIVAGAIVAGARAQNAYIRTNLVSNLPELHPQILDPLLLDAWGVTLRPLRVFEHRLELNAPWGMVIGPADFGGLSGTLLVSNFGDGTIVAFDADTGEYIDYLRTPEGEPVAIDGIWGMKFGSGVRLGHANHLYFAAGPNGEADGLFGKLEPLVPRAGDMNCDGKVDMRDRAGFFLALRDPAGYAAAHPSCTARNADCNFDGRVDAADVPAFNRLILKGGGR